MINYVRYGILFFMLFFSFSSWCQNNSLNVDFDLLKERLEKTNDLSKRIKLIEQYLDKVRQEECHENILKGLELKVTMVRDTALLDTANRLIALSDSLNKDYYRPIGRFYKGVYFHRNRNFRIAIRYFIEASDIINNLEEEHPYDLKIRQGLALLKQRFGDYESSKEDLLHISKDFLRKKDTTGFVRTAFSLFIAYDHLNKIDSSYYYLQKAKRINSEKKELDYLLDIGLGIVAYHRKKFGKSIKLLSQAKKKVDSTGDYSNGSFCRYFIASSLEGLDRKNEALSLYQQIDSIYTKHNYLHPDLRGAYEKLISNARSKGDSKEELAYIRKLISIDSVNTIDGQTLQNEILTNYEIPQLVERKNQLISEYEKKSKREWWNYSILGVLLIISVTIIFGLRAREKKKDKRFEEILGNIKLSDEVVESKTKKTSLSKAVVKKLNQFFEHVESVQLYTKSDFGKALIMRHTNVNGHYITDYVRDVLETNLVTYLNDKRVELALEKMMKDKQFIKYTLKGMAETLGYNNIQTFNKAFKDRHGIRPSEFLNRLKKEGKNS